jgi:hypothetical protein
MAISCKVLNDILRDSQKYEGLKKRYVDLVKDGKMLKMNDLHNLCEEFEELQEG